MEDGTQRTARFKAEAEKNAASKAENVSTTPATSPVSEEVSTSEPSEKELDSYEHYADNDGNFHLSALDDGTNVEEGVIMENQAREPAHQQHELAVEEDAPGFEQASALMTPRGNPHYDDGGSVAEVKAGRSFGEA
jgi:hypothetical protein